MVVHQGKDLLKIGNLLMTARVSLMKKDVLVIGKLIPLLVQGANKRLSQ